MQIDERSNGGQVEIGTGEILVLVLEENPTAGFRWHLVAAGEPACVLDHDFFEAGTGAPGQAGQHTWQFRAVQNGEGSVDLVYRRGWEAEDHVSRAFHVAVRVTPG